MLELLKSSLFKQEKEIFVQMMDFAENIMKQHMNNFTVESKQNGRDVVTNADKLIEEYCVKIIHEAFPDDEVIAEEMHNANTCIEADKRYWVIDPLDGTWNFANHIPVFAFQAALVVDRIVQLSAIIIPFGIEGTERYFAQKNCGAYLNGKRMAISQRNALEKTIIALGDICLWNMNSVRHELYFVENTRPYVGLYRIFGSSAISFANVAASHVDAYISFGQKPWDVVPGILLTEECGCHAYCFDGTPYVLGTPDFIVINNTPGLDRILLASIQS